MKIADFPLILAWYFLAVLLAVFTYFYGLDGQHIPKNGDEYPYEHITRLTADSGKLLPLQSQMDNMRNTKPPLLFWQGIASTGWGKDWTLWNLRYPSVVYTLLTAWMVFLLGWKLSRQPGTGFLAALAFLAFFSTYRYGRPFLTNPPEVFWIFLPFFILLYWRRAFESRFFVPLLLGVCIGIGFLYKSFALGLPVTLGLIGWHLHHRDYRVATFLAQDARKIAIAISVSVALFGLWFLLDPDPQAVWNEFVVGENVGKFDPQGPSYLSKLLWGGSSVWGLALAFISNAGLLVFPVIALFFVAYKRRDQMSDEEKLLWIWIFVMFLSFSLPSQRSGRYLLAAMPALAVLCALNWNLIDRKAFVLSLVTASGMIAAMAHFSLRLQQEMANAHLYPPAYWLLLAGTGTLALLAIFAPRLTRPSVSVVALLVLLCLAAFLRPFDGPPGNYNAETLRYASGKEIWVQCNFRAKDEGHRFLLPGAEIHGYNDGLGLTAAQLATRYPLFTVKLPLKDIGQDIGCASCKIIGQRLDLHDRHSSAELKEMFLEGKVFQHLFVREFLIEAPGVGKNSIPRPAVEDCR